MRVQLLHLVWKAKSVSMILSCLLELLAIRKYLLIIMIINTCRVTLAFFATMINSYWVTLSCRITMLSSNWSKLTRTI